MPAGIIDSEAWLLGKPFRAKAMILCVKDVFRRLVESRHQGKEGDHCRAQRNRYSSVLGCLRPSGSPPGVHRAVFSPKPVHHADYRHFFVRQTEDFFPHFAAVGGVSRFILQSRDQ
jgi:hypothetical protein